MKDGIREASSEFKHILQSIKHYTLSEFISLLLYHTNVQFFGYVHIQTGNPSDIVVREDYFQIQICGNKNDSYKLIVADVQNKKIVCIWKANSMNSYLMKQDLSGLEEERIIDLERTGRRWEGGVLNGEGFGYGEEYNDDNYLVYEGFMFGGRRVCYGKEYRGICNNRNINEMVYEGGYCNGDRYGYGKSYDLNGNVEYEGEWVDNNPVNIANVMPLLIKHGNELLVSSLIEEIVIEDGWFNEHEIISLRFSLHFIRLKRIVIGNCCFANVCEFVLDGLALLESVKIGNYCFLSSYNMHFGDKVCKITNCPNLRQLEIGEGNFVNFRRFELASVCSLQCILIDKDCFRNVHEFVLDGLDGLETVKIGSNCFLHVNYKIQGDKGCKITNCRNLRQLEIGYQSFMSTTRFELSSVDSLQSIKFGRHCFEMVNNFILKGE